MDTSRVDLVKQLLDRRSLIQIPTKEEVIKRLSAKKKLKIYLGIDPTSSDLHLGHIIPLLTLKALAELGHSIIILIGDFTAMIGDPTDKSSVRKVLTAEQITQNMQTYGEQLQRVMRDAPFQLKYNSSWLKKLKLESLIDLMSQYSVQQMMERDMFQVRQQEKKPIYLHEFLYPLMQGYDSVVMKVDAEVGGNDQLFNMLVGRELSATYLKKDKLVFTTKLLVDNSTGKKMSKSEGNLIALNDKPKDMFGKIMAGIPDSMIRTVFELCTEELLEDIASWEQEFSNPKDFKLQLALHLVQRYYSETDAIEAKAEFERATSNNQTPQDIPEFVLTDIDTILDVLLSAGSIQSKNDGRRLIEQKGISINHQTVTSWDTKVKKGDVIKIGSHRFLRIV